MKKITLLAVLFTLAMIVGGCTAEMTMHYPGKMNAIDTHESAKTIYRGYTPPVPMNPPDGYTYEQ